jgi:hypothetical protein
MEVQVLQGDVREVYRQLEDHSIDCVITSPPYWRQRDYGVAGQIGQEGSPEEYAKEIAHVFSLLWDKLKTTATVFLNIGYKYENEEFLLVPEMVAWEMRKVGYVLKNKIIWHKPNAMPTSARNRLANTYEAVLFFVKNVGKEVYYFNLEEIGQKPKLSYPVADLLGLTVEDSLTFSFKRVGRVLEVQGSLVKVLWEDGTAEWFSFSLQQWRARFECVRCGQVLSYWDVHLVYANKGGFECKNCGESSLPKPFLVEPSFGSRERAGVFQSKSRKYERAKLLASSPSGRLAVSGEKLVIKRKWIFPQGLIADYLRQKLKESGLSLKQLGELMERPHTVGHWLRKDFSHWGKGGRIPTTG